MTEWDSTHSNINLKTFDIVRRKEKIQNIFKIKKPLD